LYTMLTDLMSQDENPNAENAYLLSDQLIKIFEGELGIEPVVSSGTEEAHDPLPLIDPLNEREIEILSLASTCLTNKQIADQLGMTVATVKWYMQRIYSKLGVHKRLSAVNRAKQLCIIR